MQFQSIIGQQDFINKLIDMTVNKRFPHTQLFLGKTGSQKLAIAIAYAQFINCDNPQFYSEEKKHGLIGDSCGECPSCKQFQHLEHPDLRFYYPNNTGKKITKDSRSEDYSEEWREIVKEKNAEFSLQEWYDKIEITGKQGYINVRDLTSVLEVLAYKNFSAKHRVIIFWMAENFYHDLETRLLKMFEEPADGTIFILICEDTSRLAGTTISRSQIFKVPSIKNFEHSNESKAYNHAKFMEWMRLLYKFSPYESLNFAKEINGLGREKAKLFLTTCLEELHYCLLQNSRVDEYINLSDEEKTFIAKFAPFVTPEKLNLLSEEINTAIYQIERNCIISLVMMDLTIKLKLV